MADRLMVQGLRHEAHYTPDEEFFALIDSCGGWPVGYQYVGFEHSQSRDAGFCNSSRNDGWWTVVASADDYYLWKLTPVGLQRVADAVVASIRTPKVNAQMVHIKNWAGRKAAIQKGEKAHG